MLAHWDDVETREVAVGEMRGTWRNLGHAVGSVRVGCRRVVVPPGGRTTPAHVHTGEEEMFYVLGGAGLSWQNGVTYEVAAGDCLLHLADTEAHTLIAGEEGLDVLAFGTRVPTEIGLLPRAGVAWLSGGGQVWTNVGGDHPFAHRVLPAVGEGVPTRRGGDGKARALGVLGGGGGLSSLCCRKARLPEGLGAL
jgi:uncharacterized cupin superfamily protein